MHRVHKGARYTLLQARMRMYRLIPAYACALLNHACVCTQVILTIYRVCVEDDDDVVHDDGEVVW